MDNNIYYKYTHFYRENVEMCYFGKLALDKRQAQ